MHYMNGTIFIYLSLPKMEEKSEQQVPTQFFGNFY
jgi:hypothetical protein